MNMELEHPPPPLKLPQRPAEVRTETKVSQGAMSKNKGLKTECQGKPGVIRTGVDRWWKIRMLEERRVPLDKREGSVKAKISRAVPRHRFFRQRGRGPRLWKSHAESFP